MAEDNVEIARRAIDAWNRQDMDALLALSDPEIVYVNSPSAVEPGTRHGQDGFRAVLQAQWEILAEGRLETERIYERGDEIIALGCLSRRMPGSEGRIEDQALLSWKMRGGRLVRMEVLGFGSAEVEDALKAAGLPD